MNENLHRRSDFDVVDWILRGRPAPPEPADPPGWPTSPPDLRDHRPVLQVIDGGRGDAARRDPTTSG